jgi:hypothetical protein
MEEKESSIGKKVPSEKSSTAQTVPWGTNDLSLRDVQLNKKPIPDKRKK